MRGRHCPGLPLCEGRQDPGVHEGGRRGGGAGKKDQGAAVRAAPFAFLHCFLRNVSCTIPRKCVMIGYGEGRRGVGAPAGRKKIIKKGDKVLKPNRL